MKRGWDGATAQLKYFGVKYFSIGKIFFPPYLGKRWSSLALSIPDLQVVVAAVGGGGHAEVSEVD